jgi:hypothetical protein
LYKYEAILVYLLPTHKCILAEPRDAEIETGLNVLGRNSCCRAKLKTPPAAGLYSWSWPLAAFLAFVLVQVVEKVHITSLNFHKSLFFLSEL